MKIQSIPKIALLVAIAGMACAPKADATLTYTVNTLANGLTPSSPGPWLTAQFTTISVGVVQLKLTSSVSNPSEFFSAFAFNINPTITPSSLTITDLNATDPKTDHIYKAAQNGQAISSVTGFDFLFSWPTANSGGGIHRFDGTDVDTFTLAYSGLTENDFNFATAGGNHVGAKLQGIVSSDLVDGPTAGTHGAVPEPSTIVAGALLLLPFGVSTLRILRKSRQA